MKLKFRLSGMLLIIFLAIFFDFFQMEFRWNILTGVCDDYNRLNEQCLSGEKLDLISKFKIYFDIPSIFFVWGITLFGTFFYRRSVIEMLEGASHLAKDAAELGAAIGAIQAFRGVFNEATISNAFGVIFTTYFIGLLTSILCHTFANWFRAKEKLKELPSNPMVNS